MKNTYLVKNVRGHDEHLLGQIHMRGHEEHLLGQIHMRGHDEHLLGQIHMRGMMSTYWVKYI